MKKRIYIWADTCDKVIKGHYYSEKELKNALIKYYKDLLKEDPTDEEISTTIKELKSPDCKDINDIEMACDTDVFVDYIEIEE